MGESTAVLGFNLVNCLFVLNKKQRVAAENHLLLELWYKSQCGDSVAFRHLADRLYRSLFNYAFNFTRDRDFIKDSIQELLITIWKKREQIHIEFVSIYFLKSMRNQLFKEFRRSDAANLFLDIDDFDDLSDYQNIELSITERETSFDDQYRIKRAIEELPKRQKEAVFLKYYEGMDNDKIADLMHINKQSVANLLFKALSTLKTQIA